MREREGKEKISCQNFHSHARSARRPLSTSFDEKQNSKTDPPRAAPRRRPQRSSRLSLASRNRRLAASPLRRSLRRCPFFLVPFLSRVCPLASARGRGGGGGGRRRRRLAPLIFFFSALEDGGRGRGGAVRDLCCRLRERCFRRQRARAPTPLFSLFFFFFFSFFLFRRRPSVLPEVQRTVPVSFKGRRGRRRARGGHGGEAHLVAAGAGGGGGGRRRRRGKWRQRKQRRRRKRCCCRLGGQDGSDPSQAHRRRVAPLRARAREALGVRGAAAVRRGGNVAAAAVFLCRRR